MKINLIIIAIGMFFSLNVSGQNFSFENFSTEKGLAQSQVNTICQDQDNYIWIGTLEGLSRFDGKEFISFFKEDGLPDNNIIRLVSFKDNIVGATRDNIFIIHNTKITVVKTPAALNDITDVVVKDSVIWFSTLKNGLFSYIHKNNTLIPFEVVDVTVAISVNRLSVINKELYICSSNGLYVLADKKITPLSGFPDVVCTGVTSDSEGNLWISTFKEGIFKIEKETRLLVNYNEKNSKIASNYLRDVYSDLGGNIWFASKKSITKFSKDGKVNNFTESNGFNYVAETIFQDSQGNIWVGTEGKGIVKFISEEFTYLTRKEGLNSDLILSFCEDNEGNVWFSSYGDGVAKQQGDEFVKYTSFNSALANNTVWCSLKDNSGKLWFGTADGLSCFDGKNFKTFNEKDGLPSKKVQALYEDEQGIWIGTKNGIVKFNQGVFEKETIIQLKNVRNIYKEEHAKIWIASSEGLFFIKNKEVLKFNDTLFTDATIYNIVSNNNVLWVGTSLGLFQIKNNKVQKVALSTQKKGSEIVNFLIKDNANFIWVGTNNGVYVIDNLLDSITIKKYKTTDGLIGTETNLNAVFQDSKGNIWMGTSEGVSIFKRINFKNKNTYKPQIIITSVKLFYENKNLIKDTLNKSFKFNRNHFTFYYNTPYFGSSDGVKYSYILEGFENNWSPPENVSFARYSNIPHGNYTFKVKSTADGVVWSSVKTYSFTIKRPFWLAWWFRIATLFIAFLIVYLLYKRQKNKAFEKQEKELLNYKNKLIKLEQQSLNASLNRHFIFNALNSIQFYINKEDKLSANRYLSSFAKLIRKNLDSSSNEDNLLPLNEEIERLTLYLSLEKMRFKDRFEYYIDIEESINQDKTMVPGMFLQPFVENSIWHGVLPTEKEGVIKIKVYKQDNKIHFLITDNGIGISQSIKNKENELKTHTSKGMIIASNRIALLEKISGKQILLDGPKDLIENGIIKGTVVEIIFS